MGINRAGVVGLVASGMAVLPVPVVGQSLIVPDDTLGAERSQVNTVGNIERITGGARRSQNLFHSFEEFNVSEGRGAFFESPVGLENIFSRVTGGNASEIFGTLGVDGAANLFFLNPNGIVFGESASLDVEGSFVGSAGTGFNFADGSEFSAVNPGDSSLLTVSVPLGLQYGPNPQGATISNRGAIAAGQDLTLSADVLDLQGQVFAGGDLTLQATDLLQIRDSVAEPFIAASVGEMLVQGDRAVDIFALSHPESGLFSGGDMVLRSANAVGGDAHYWSGGSFRIEQTDGSFGELYSPNDPIIRSFGDISFNNYAGTSLHIIAGGSVNIPGVVVITGTDQLNSLNESIILSNGETLLVDGSSQPTLDIRAGVNAESIGVPVGLTGTDGLFLDFGFNVEAPSILDIASSANIQIGGIGVAAPNGLIFLSSSYIPESSLLDGDISVNTIRADDAFLGFNGDGGRIVIDSRGSIEVQGLITSSSSTGNSGNVDIIAQQDIQLSGASIRTNSLTSSGDITIESNNFARTSMPVRGDIFLENTSIDASSDTGTGGDIALISGGSIQIKTSGELLFQRSLVSGSTAADEFGSIINVNAGEDISIENSIIQNSGGGIRLEAEGDIRVSDGFISSFPVNELSSRNSLNIVSKGQLLITDSAEFNLGGNLDIDAHNIQVIDSEIENNIVLGNGVIELHSVESIEVKNSLISLTLQDNTDLSNSQSGIDISAASVKLVEGGILLSRLLGSGVGGNIEILSSGPIIISEINEIGDSSAIFSTVSFLSNGNGGHINLVADSLAIDNGGLIQSLVEGTLISGLSPFNLTQTGGRGNAGSISINVDDTVAIIGTEVAETSIDFGDIQPDLRFANAGVVDDLRSGGIGSYVESEAVGNSGNISIEANSLALLDGARLDTSNFGTGNSGDIALNLNGALSLSGTNVFRQIEGTEITQFLIGSAILSTIRQGARGNSGNINVVANLVSINDFSEISASSFGLGDSGEISISSNDDIDISNLSNIRSAIETGAIGNGGNININVRDLNISGGSQILTGVFRETMSFPGGQGDAGNISIYALGTITLSEVSNIDSLPFISDPISVEGRLKTLGISSGLLTVSEIGASGEAGEIEVEAENLYLRDGAVITSRTENSGSAGNIAISVDNFQAVRGGQVITNTSGSGSAGNIDLFADSAILLAGIDPTFNERLSNVDEDIPANVGASPGLFANTEVGSKGNAGDIILQTDSLRLVEQARIISSTNGQGDSGQISAQILLGTFLDDSSEISVAVEESSEGNSQQIILRTPQLMLRDNSQISAATSGTGNAGAIEILEAGAIELDDSTISTTISQNAIASQPSRITIDTRSLQLNNGADITASTAGQGDAGSITIENAERVTLDNSTITTIVNRTGSGRGGNILLSTEQLNASNSAEVTSSTFGRGNAGRINIRATGDAELSNSTVSSEVGEIANCSGGDIIFRAGNLTLSDRSQITSSSDRQSTSDASTEQGRIQGNAGSVFIAVEDTLTVEDSDIITQAEEFAGGDITIQAGDIRLVGDGDIRTDVQTGSEDGGNILLTADSIIAFDDSDIIASASQGRGGDIDLDTPAFFGENFDPAASDADPDTLEDNNQADVNATGNLDSGTITAPDTSFLQNSLADLPEGILNTDSLIANSCVVRNEDGSSTFNITGSGGLPEQPGSTVTDYSTGNIQPIPDEAEPEPDAWQFGDPIIEPQGVYQLPNGELVMSHSCQN